MNNKFMGFFLGMKMLQDNESKIPSSAQNEVKTKVFAVNLINTDNVFLNYFLTDKIIKDSIPKDIIVANPILNTPDKFEAILNSTTEISNSIDGLNITLQKLEPLGILSTKIDSVINKNPNLKSILEKCFESLERAISNLENELKANPKLIDQIKAKLISLENIPSEINPKTLEKAIDEFSNALNNIKSVPAQKEEVSSVAKTNKRTPIKK